MQKFNAMVRKAVEAIYYRSAMWMPAPMRWKWTGVYVMKARFYFECNEQPEFRGWPWNWTMEFLEDSIKERRQ